jgi:hypothetical protein
MLQLAQAGCQAGIVDAVETLRKFKVSGKQNIVLRKNRHQRHVATAACWAPGGQVYQGCHQLIECFFSLQLGYVLVTLLCA